MPKNKIVSGFAKFVQQRQEENRLDGHRRCSSPEMIKVAGNEWYEMTDQQKDMYKPRKNSRSKL